jgi:hypothetical protein
VGIQVGKFDVSEKKKIIFGRIIFQIAIFMNLLSYPLLLQMTCGYDMRDKTDPVIQLFFISVV